MSKTADRSARPATGHARAKPSVTTHPAFPAIVAMWFGALLGIGVMVLPAAVLEAIVGATGLPAIVAAAAPPLGMTARLLLGGLAALGGAGLGYLLARFMLNSSRAPADDYDAAEIAEDNGADITGLPDATPGLSLTAPAAEPEVEAPESGWPKTLKVEELGTERFDSPFDDEATPFAASTILPGRRRSLAMAEQDATDDYADAAPVPGAAHDDVQPRDDIPDDNELGMDAAEGAPDADESGTENADFSAAENRDNPAEDEPFDLGGFDAPDAVLPDDVNDDGVSTPAVSHADQTDLASLDMDGLLNRLRQSLQANPAADVARSGLPSGLADMRFGTSRPTGLVSDPALIDLPDTGDYVPADLTLDDDVAEEDRSDGIELASLDLSQPMAAVRSAMLTPVGDDYDLGETDEYDHAFDNADGEDDLAGIALGDDSYSSLLAMRSPYHADTAELVDDTAQYTPDHSPNPLPFARPQETVASADTGSDTGFFGSYDNAQGEQALRDALAGLQRNQGVR